MYSSFHLTMSTISRSANLKRPPLPYHQSVVTFDIAAPCKLIVMVLSSSLAIYPNVHASLWVIAKVSSTPLVDHLLCIQTNIPSNNLVSRSNNFRQEDAQ